MLNALMINRYGKIYKQNFLFFIFLILLSCSADAEVYRPLQIFLPGNLHGNLANLDENLQALPSYGWRIPDTIEAFRKEHGKDTITFATGNDSNIFSPLSFLFNGTFERDLINRCSPDAAGLSPADLETFNDCRLSQQIRQRIFTNIETEAGGTIFRPFQIKKLGNRNIWFFNHIEKSRCETLPMHKWGQFIVEDPARAMRRLNPSFGNSDISLSVVYADKSIIENLIYELKSRPGYHFVVQVPEAEKAPLFSTISPEREQNIYKMSLLPGHTYLPLINVFSRNSGYPRLTLRMLPLGKSRSENATGYFNMAWLSMKESLFETLRVIKTTSRASTSANRFSNQSHAHLVRSATAADVAFLIVPAQKHINDNVICTGNIITSMQNDRIQRFRLTGLELQRLAENLLQKHSSEEMAFSGLNFRFLAGRVLNFAVSEQAVQPEKIYIAVTTEQTMADPIVAEFLKNRSVEKFAGIMLWNVWKNNLKTLRISDENLFE